ncbi:glycosyltransferase [Winogradskyella undariae]|uniref:glycosyltransferase n=1 Tax=Winogradskyella undariae TaxID=1285465 RepID=UPI0015CBE841|nr:glycosyltransferase [Winogradskyella undariae]
MIHFLYAYFLTSRPKQQSNTLQKKVRWQLFKYLKGNLFKYYNDMSLIGLNTNDSPVIVSLTSIPDRIHLVPIVIKSILYQTFKPSKVILWLGVEKFPNGEKDLTANLLELKSYGLEIYFRKDLKPHTKYYYAFKEYPQNLIVTVDDDLFYPKDLLERLMKSYKLYPNCIIANRVRVISFKNGVISPYRDWVINPKNLSGPSNKLLATGVSGVLYSPQLFTDAVLNIENIKKTSLNADDIWLKACELNDDIPVVFTNHYFTPFIEIPESQRNSLHSKNVFKAENDIQIKNAFHFFNIKAKINDK